MQSDIRFISILGWPGVGKGYSIAEYLKKYPDAFIHVSYGDVMREAALNYPQIKKLRELALDWKQPFIERDGAFRKLEMIFVNELLPNIVAHRSSVSKLFLLDNFPQHPDAFKVFEDAFPTNPIELFIHLNTNNFERLVKNMLERKRIDSDTIANARQRLHNYQKIVIKWIDKLSKIRKPQFVTIDADYGAVVDVVTSYFDILLPLFNATTPVADTKAIINHNNPQILTIEDPKLEIMKIWIQRCNAQNIPNAYMQTVSGAVALSNCWSEYEDSHCKRYKTKSCGKEWYIIINPRYNLDISTVQSGSSIRFVMWPVVIDAPPTTIEISTKYASKYRRLDLEKSYGIIPCNIVDLITRGTIDDIKLWIDQLSEIRIFGIEFVSKALNQPKDKISCFLHYPGASFYSIIHIHFTFGYDINYNRAHDLLDIIDDLNNLVTQKCTRDEILHKYKIFTSSFSDWLEYFRCMQCGMETMSTYHRCRPDESTCHITWKYGQS